MTASPTGYVPAAEDWAAVTPSDAGMRADALADAVRFHLAHETGWRRDFLTDAGRYIGVADEPPGPDEVPGPVRPRGGPSGLVLRGGRLVAEWGDTARVDVSFSVAKSYLAVVAGLAHARGLVPDLDAPVGRLVDDGGFAGPHNVAVTWRHLLQQTSEWQGTLWGKSDTIDHNRDVGKNELGASDKGRARRLAAPGTHWEYNDVRVNRLSLALLRRFGRPLADVLRESVMDPLGASRTWEWLPYRNSWAIVGGRLLPSVPGGSHWGGGLVMSTRDHARLALLVLRRGWWGSRELLPSGWVDEMLRPSTVNPSYGLLWWLNTGRVQVPGAPERGVAARGAGSNVLWIDPDHDLVLVARWIDKAHVAGLVERVTAAVRA